MAKKPAPPKTAPTPKAVEENTAAAENALEAAAEAAENDDAEAFDAAIAEAQERIANIEKDITWIKAEIKKTTPIPSTLESLSSQITEMKDRLTELTDKFQSLMSPKLSEPAKPSTETPAIQAVTEVPAPPKSQSHVKGGDQEGAEPAAPAAKQRRFRLI